MRDERLFRVIGCPEHARPCSDLLVYDASGVCRFDRLDDIGDPHDVLPRGHDVVISSSRENAVFSVRPSGEVSTLFSAEAPEDSWHLNGLVEVDGELYATAFGIFNQHRAWSRNRHVASGVLVRLHDGSVVLGGLTQPHSPRRFDGLWVVCNSALNEVAAYDDDGRVARSVRLGGYTRGLAVDENFLYVGESASRHINNGEAARASRVTILDRGDWSVVDSFDVDAAEIYDVLIVPERVADGAAIGFRTNASRVAQQDQLDMFATAGVKPRRLWAVGDPLPIASLRVEFFATIPSTLEASEVLVLPCTVKNNGDAIFVSAPPNPIEFCYRWFDEHDAPVGAGTWIHTPLPRALPPGESLEAAVRIEAPHAAGTYTLAVTLLQEGVAWFDDVSPAGGARGSVVVRSR